MPAIFQTALTMYLLTQEWVDGDWVEGSGLRSTIARKGLEAFNLEP